jgi:hypothetical protein
MKTIRNILSLCLIALTFWSCADDEKNANFVNTATAPTALAMQFEVTQDNTGLVTITPLAEGAVSFDIAFGDDTEEPVSLENGENVSHTYEEGTYTVSAIAYGVTGLTSTLSQELVISFQAPTNLEVLIENDSSISKKVNVTVNADYAVSFDVYSGETGATDPVSANIGETVELQYTDAGFYDITIEVLGAAIETTTYIEENFEVTEILAPLIAAPTPTPRQPEDVVSIFSDAYTNVTLDELPTSWSSSGFEATTVAADNLWKLTNLDFVGMVTNYEQGIDLSQMETMHIDYWVPEDVSNELIVKIVNTVDGGEDIESLGTTVSGSWQSIELDMTGFDGGNLANKEKITQILIDSEGTASVVYVDNFYFYKQPSNATAQIIDFEPQYSELSSFDGGAISVIANPDTNGNSSSTVAQMVKNSGQPWGGSKITLDAPFDVSNPIVNVKVWSPRAGLNLLMKFEDDVPWPGVTGSAEITVATTVANQWETLTFDHSGIDLNIDWYNMVLIMDNGTVGDGSANYTIYLDDFSTSPVLDFEPQYSELSSFDGGGISVIANPDANGNSSINVAQMVKNSGQPWGGSKVTSSTPFQINSAIVTVKVWSPRAGLNLLMKFEDDVPWPGVTGSAEITVATTVANQWETLTFDHSGIDSNIDWYNMVLIMDNGTVGDGSANYTIFLDDITIN